MDPPLWLFGYGSLIWRPDFSYEERVCGYISGWARRFWQGSTDHRGVPGAPGRVVTLVEVSDGQCWGTAYRVATQSRAGVLQKLDRREQGGYRRRQTRVHPQAGSGPPIEALVYVASADNPNYLGPAPMASIAEQVRRSRGPSGANLEYVLELAEALRRMGVVDEHVTELEKHLSARGY